MNKPNLRRYNSALARTIWGQYLVALVAWLGASVALSVAAFLLMHQFVWYKGDPLYEILSFVQSNLLFFLAGLVLLGWIAISYFFIARPLRYLDDVVQAATRLAGPENEPVTLPKELEGIQNDMNLAKQRAALAQAAAREAEQRKNDLIVYLAHDLKTPLTSVVGYLTLLKDEPDLSPETRARYTCIALDKALRLEDLQNEFFEITRFNLTQMELETAPVDVSLLLRQLAAEFEPVLAGRGLTLQLNTPDALAYRCDAGKLVRVFENLLRNACGYTPEGGEIQLEAGQGSQSLVVTVKNPGRTIPPEKLARIFEQFYRLDSSRGTASGGAGLGLAIAKQIVELHGGQIAAASENDWVQFTVTLPSQ